MAAKSACVCAIVALTGLSVVTAAPPKVILLMLADDYGFNNVGYAHGPLGVGNAESMTPNIDRLAMEGVRLERHYVFKYCSPTRSSLMSGRLPVHVNQNNLCNDIESTSGIDLRMTILPAKLKTAGYETSFVGKWHGGARSTANLPINRGFDQHLGFLKGGEDHYNQKSGSAHGEGSIVDLWEDTHPALGINGTYSGFMYTDRALKVFKNFTSTGGLEDPNRKAFMYLAWHNTHTPLECPQEFMYPSDPAYNNSCPIRMTYNCMSRILDDGIGNVTQMLRDTPGLWDETLVIWSADNGGWVYDTGSSNWPLRGSKVSDFEGGVRAVAFVSGGYLPIAVRGGVHTGYISIADWYGTLCKLAGVNANDDDAGDAVPPIDSIDIWPSLITPNATSTPRTEILLSYSNGSFDPTGGQAKGDMALISGDYKIIFGVQEHRGTWQGKVYPNCSKDGPTDAGCPLGCLFNINEDPTEHNDLRLTDPDTFSEMLVRLQQGGKTVFQTDYAEPNTEHCISGPQGFMLYHGFQGPMCGVNGPPVPPPPPTPPPTPPFSLALIDASGNITGCLAPHNLALKVPVWLGACSTASNHWTLDPSSQWIEWQSYFLKLNETSLDADLPCERGTLYLNPAEGSPGPAYQGISLKGASLISSCCDGYCVAVDAAGPAKLQLCDDKPSMTWRMINATQF